MESELLMALAEASALVARLDERLSSAPQAVMAGWLERSLLDEAAASARLNGDVVDALELRLFDADALGRMAAPGVADAATLLGLLRRASRRSPRHLFTPLRLMSWASPRLRTARAGQRPIPPWIRSRQASAADLRADLAAVLAPDVLRDWRRQAPLIGAADLLARWHASPCAARIGAGPGRALAAVWVRRAGLTRTECLMPSTGFLGAREAYAPAVSERWHIEFAAACARAATRGLLLHDRLAQAHLALTAYAAGLRASSRMPELVALLLAKPCLTATDAARELAITPRGASALLERLRHEGPLGPGRRLVGEIAARESFRIYAVA